ncbi:MAG: hypothetical protein AAF891_00330 [Pseudomonadota bacterium]
MKFVARHILGIGDHRMQSASIDTEVAKAALGVPGGHEVICLGILDLPRSMAGAQRSGMRDPILTTTPAFCVQTLRLTKPAQAEPYLIL